MRVKLSYVDYGGMTFRRCLSIQIFSVCDTQIQCYTSEQKPVIMRLRRLLYQDVSNAKKWIC